MQHLELENLTKRFGHQTALDDFNLSVKQGEFISLLGPSGCGKTTTIRLISGFLSPTRGRILVSGRDITSLPPEKRNMGMVFQSYALFPHLNVFENVAFGLKARRTPRYLIRDKVKRALAWVNLTRYEDRSVFELSGGEQQRVAIARTIVTEPQILLLDEPLSNLDASLREHTRKQLRELITSLGITAIFVTHDQEEAFALSDRIALLSQGVCQQVGTAQELYHLPANEFVAHFIGKSNILSLPLRACREDCLIFLLSSGNELRLRKAQKQVLQEGKIYRLLVRPESIKFEKTAANSRLFSATIIARRFAGPFLEYELEGDGLRLLALQASCPHKSAYPLGKTLETYCAPDAIHVLGCEE